MTDQDTEPTKFHSRAPTLFKPSEHTLLTRGLNMATKACEAQVHTIEALKKELAECELKYQELIARNNQLEERHILNMGSPE